MCRAGAASATRTPRSSTLLTASAAAMPATRLPARMRSRRALRSLNGGCPARILLTAAHILQQRRAGVAQPLRQHGDELDQNLRAQTGFFENDTAHVFAGEHPERGFFERHAGRKARLAVYHRHFAERHAGHHRRQQLLLAHQVLLVDVDFAADHQQHIVANVALANDHLPGFRMVDAHVAREQVDVVTVEFGEKLRAADQAEYLIRKCRAAAQVLERGERLAIASRIRNFRHACSTALRWRRSGYCSVSISLIRRRRTPSASVSSSFWLSSQLMQPSVMLCP